MLIIKVGDKKDDLEKALKVYKNKHKKTGLMKDIRDQEEYVKPSVKKRAQKRKAIYINQKYRQNED